LFDILLCYRKRLSHGALQIDLGVIMNAKTTPFTKEQLEAYKKANKNSAQ